MSLKIVRKSLHPWTLGDLTHVSYRSPGVRWGQGIRDVGNEAPWSHLRILRGARQHRNTPSFERGVIAQEILDDF